MTAERVLIPQTPSSVLYHALTCRMFDRSRAVEMAREDAEDVLGRRPAPCLQNSADHDPDHRQEVPA